MRTVKYFLVTTTAISIAFLNCSCHKKTSLGEKQDYVLEHILIKAGQQKKMMSLTKAMAYFKVPAISFAVIQNNKLSWIDAVGYTKPDHNQKVDTNTLFQAGSMSKSVAAATTMSLIDRGIINLDTAVNPLLNSLRIAKTDRFKHHKITLRQLLDMSSGLSVGTYRGYVPGQKLPTLVQTLRGMRPANNPPTQILYQPGTRYHYSSGAYEVLRFAINSYTPLSFVQTTQKYIFMPLKMHHSYYGQPLPERLGKNVAFATNADGHPFPYKWRIMPEYAAAGLWSTPGDLAKFVLSVIKADQGKKHEAISPTMARFALEKESHTPYGLGFALGGQGKQFHFMKLGQSPGYQGWLVGFPKTGQGAVVMTNSDNGRNLAQSLIYAIARTYHWPTTGKLQDAWMLR